MKNQSSANAKDVAILCSIFNVGKCQKSLAITDLFTHGKLLLPEICSIYYSPLVMEGYKGTFDNTSMHVDYLYDKLSYADKIAIGHQVKQMVLSCSFYAVPNHRACQFFQSGIPSFPYPSSGLCHSFNFHPKWFTGEEGLLFANQSDLASVVTGIGFGLELEINIDSGMSINNGLTKQQGVKVLFILLLQYSLV